MILTAGAGMITKAMIEINDNNAQEVVNDLNAAYYYLPEELQPSIRRATRFIAERFGVIDDDTELEAQKEYG